MITKIDKNAVRQRRHARVRKTVTGTAEAPRMNVYRSLNHIYVQIIDDRKGNEKGGVTIASASTMDKAVKEQIAGLSKTDAAKVVGKVAAERALEKGVKAVVFDRGGYLYTGRVKAVADGAREAGLDF
ncbi:MAG: 50S ribosomal protein L18 [Clostridiales bacterium]|jgi:large subunit ribosomal protein L18|nr:50S ribosomal protein L18 [Clostridiales bacterium]MBQ3019561.1 50S ribosomal protein L18 [Clostridia bacterium]